MQYHVPNMKKYDNKTWIERSEKWSDYYTCKKCEDEVNRKVHLTKPQEADFCQNPNSTTTQLNLT